MKKRERTSYKRNIFAKKRRKSKKKEYEGKRKRKKKAQNVSEGKRKTKKWSKMKVQAIITKCTAPPRIGKKKRMWKDRPEINAKCVRSEEKVAEEKENERGKWMKAKTEAAIIIVETVAYFTLLLRIKYRAQIKCGQFEFWNSTIENRIIDCKQF